MTRNTDYRVAVEKTLGQCARSAATIGLLENMRRMAEWAQRPSGEYIARRAKHI